MTQKRCIFLHSLLITYSDIRMKKAININLTCRNANKDDESRNPAMCKMTSCGKSAMVTLERCETLLDKLENRHAFLRRRCGCAEGGGRRRRLGGDTSRVEDESAEAVEAESESSMAVACGACAENAPSSLEDVRGVLELLRSLYRIS